MGYILIFKSVLIRNMSYAEIDNKYKDRLKYFKNNTNKLPYESKFKTGNETVNGEILTD